LAGLSEASWHYRPKPNPGEAALRERLRTLAHQRPAFGSPRLTVLVRRELGPVNHKRIERLYAEEGLQLPRRAKRRRRGVMRSMPTQAPTAPGQRGSMDFVHDVLADGRRIRVLTIVDDYSRECLALEVDTSLTGQRVSRVLDALRQTGKLPPVMVCDNGTEFTSRVMLKWSQAHAVKLHFITPGKPTENAFIESFNGKLRHECLRQHWFASLAEARQIVEDWREDYNHVRPHRSLGQRTPMEVLKQHEINPGLSLGVL
jgi:putative transposase